MQSDFSLYDAVASPIFVLTEDQSGEIVYAYLNACGLQSMEREPSDVIGKNALEVFSGRAAQVIYQRQWDAWRGGVETSYEVANPKPQGTFWMQARLLPHVSDDGRVTHMVGVVQDITREKWLEQEQAISAAMAEEIEDFVSFAAHDLRSPLANVHMLVELLRDGFVDMGDGKLEIMQMIEDISTRALDIVTDVLSHTTSLRTEVKPTPVALKQLCDNIVVTLDPTDNHSVDVADLTVETDAIVLQILLRNLLDNAFKYAGLSHVKVQIDVTQLPQARVQMTVSNDGDVFDVGEASARPSKAGFGLAGVTRLVRARGGTVETGARADGTGAMIRFHIPGTIVPGHSAQGAA